MNCWTTFVSPSPGSLNSNHLLGQGPDLFEPVVLALLFAEDVQHEVAEIDEYPTGVGFAFTMVNGEPGFFDLLDEGVGDGVELAHAVDAHDDHEVGEATDRVDVEQHDIGRLAVRRDVDGEMGGLVGGDGGFRGSGGACHLTSIRGRPALYLALRVMHPIDRHDSPRAREGSFFPCRRADGTGRVLVRHVRIFQTRLTWAR